jgi:2,3-dihydroxybenzoate decarboxylase
MSVDRRDFLKSGLGSAALVTGLAAGAEVSAAASGAAQYVAPTPLSSRKPKPPARVPYKRIATEEAWISREVMEGFRTVLERKTLADPGFEAQWNGYFGGGNTLMERLLDIGERRIGDMDAAGIDVQILSLTAPGVQVFEPAVANALAISSNDQVAAAVRKYPTRYRALAAVAPQDPKAAAKEIQRAKQQLKLNGVIVNSHTMGEYLDDPKFWEIFEAAESHDMPIYLHPQTPSPAMIKPYLDRGMERAMLGFAHEVSLHILGIITSGAFDRFPNLKFVIGHGGEGLPYMLYRIDYMYQNARFKRPKTKLLPSDYMKRNIYITSSGLAYGPAITMAQRELGMDRVLYAMDYPYQYDIDEVTASDNMQLSAEEKKMFFQSNAEKVFGLT